MEFVFAAVWKLCRCGDTVRWAAGPSLLLEDLINTFDIQRKNELSAASVYKVYMSHVAPGVITFLLHSMKLWTNKFASFCWRWRWWWLYISGSSLLLHDAICWSTCFYLCLFSISKCDTMRRSGFGRTLKDSSVYKCNCSWCTTECTSVNVSIRCRCFTRISLLCGCSQISIRCFMYNEMQQSKFWDSTQDLVVSLCFVHTAPCRQTTELQQQLHSNVSLVNKRKDILHPEEKWTFSCFHFKNCTSRMFLMFLHIQERQVV